MMRRAHWIVLVVVVLLVAISLAGALLVRPDLVDARDRVDARWADLRSDLAARYDALGAVRDALDAAGAGDRSVTRALRRELGHWAELRGRRQVDAAAEAASANSLEALARRAKVNRTASDRLRADPNLAAAVLEFDQQVVSQPAVRLYNQAVRSYETTRTGTFERIVAGVLGFESRPTLLLAPPG
jgi:hypothetical protein